MTTPLQQQRDTASRVLAELNAHPHLATDDVTFAYLVFVDALDQAPGAFGGDCWSWTEADAGLWARGMARALCTDYWQTVKAAALDLGRALNAAGGPPGLVELLGAVADQAQGAADTTANVVPTTAGQWWEGSGDLVKLGAAALVLLLVLNLSGGRRG